MSWFCYFNTKLDLEMIEASYLLGAVANGTTMS